jgi:HK97 family phage major capsid protein
MDEIEDLEAQVETFKYNGTRRREAVGELRERLTTGLKSAVEHTQGIKSAADSAGRELFASEQRDYSASVGKMARLRAAQDKLDSYATIANPMTFSTDGGGVPGGGPLREGEVRPLTHGLKMASIVGSGRPGESIGLHRYLRGLVTGNWEGVPDAAMKAMSLGGAGVYTVPEPLSAQIIDLARDASALSRAGAITFPMTASELKIPRLIADPTAVWHAENFNESASDAQFDSVTLSAKTVMAFVQMSVELAEDAPIADKAIEAALGNAIGRAIDKAGLVGAGGIEPAGLYGQVPSWNVGGPLDQYSELSKAVTAIRIANEEPNAVIYSARTAGDLDLLLDQEDRPLQPPPSVEALTKLVTNAAGDDVAFVGDFSKLAFGIRTSLRIETSRDAGDGTTGAFSALQVWIRAYARCDFAVLRPAAFRVLEGLASS